MTTSKSGQQVSLKKFMWPLNQQVCPPFDPPAKVLHIDTGLKVHTIYTFLIYKPK